MGLLAIGIVGIWLDGMGLVVVGIGVGGLVGDWACWCLGLFGIGIVCVWDCCCLACW